MISREKKESGVNTKSRSRSGTSLYCCIDIDSIEVLSLMKRSVLGLTRTSTLRCLRWSVATTFAVLGGLSFGGVIVRLPLLLKLINKLL